jgi:hypothetical protein
MLIRNVLIGMALAGLSLAGQAYAEPIFNWVPISNSGSIASASGTIELTDAAAQGSGLNYNTRGFIGSDPNSPIVDFSMTVNGKTLEIMPSTGEGSLGEFSMNVALQFNGGASPAGSIGANNQESDIAFGGDSSLWTIGRFGSDDPSAGCFEQPGCSGATGRWEFARMSDAPGAGPPSSVSVPEPPMGLLFAVGLGAVGFVRRRMRRR